MKSRKSIRLPNYNYASPALYFVTICTQKRWSILGKIKNGKMILNDVGKMVNKIIKQFNKFGNVKIDIFVIMPNHIHLVLSVGADPRVRPEQDPRVRPNVSKSTPNNISGSTQGSTPTLGNYIKKLKTLTTRIYIKNVRENNWQPFEKRFWQRNYFERIIRNQTELFKIQEYIKLNSLMWDRDRNNPIKICQ